MNWTCLLSGVQDCFFMLQDSTYKYYEIILIDPEHNAIRRVSSLPHAPLSLISPQICLGLKYLLNGKCFNCLPTRLEGHRVHLSLLVPGFNFVLHLESHGVSLTTMPG
jgi:hypothetical protein